MEAIYFILGLIMIYTWIHGAVIVGKKLKGATGYEVGVLIAGAVCFALYFIGTV